MINIKPDVMMLAAARVCSIVANRTYPADFLSENLRIQMNVMDVARPPASKGCCSPGRRAPAPFEPTKQAYATAEIAEIIQVQAPTGTIRCALNLSHPPILTSMGLVTTSTRRTLACYPLLSGPFTMRWAGAQPCGRAGQRNAAPGVPSHRRSGAGYPPRPRRVGRAEPTSEPGRTSRFGSWSRSSPKSLESEGTTCRTRHGRTPEATRRVACEGLALGAQNPSA